MNTYGHLAYFCCGNQNLLLIFQPFNSQDLTSNSPCSLTYSSCDVSLENLVLDQLIIS